MPSPQEDLCTIIFGSSDNSHSLIEKILCNLRKKTEYFSAKAFTCDFNNDDAKNLAPFYGRNILESAAIGLLSRIDPFRTSIVYNVQSDASYDIGKRALCAVEWSNDILTVKPPEKMWNAENKMDKFDRALMSAYQGELIWKPAFLEMVDYIDSQGIDSEWISELKNMDELEFYKSHLSIAQTLFSSFSKGVHSEFLIDVSNTFDTITLKNLFYDLFKWCAFMGLSSHFTIYSILPLEHQCALDTFMEIERMVHNAFR